LPSPAVKGITATTSDYNVSPVYPKRTTWEARQDLDLTLQAPPDSPGAKPMLTLIGHLQQSGLMLESLTGTLSAKAKRQAEQAAIRDAVKRLKEQAEIVAAALGDQPGRITKLRLNISRPPLPISRLPMAMAATAPSISAAPVGEQASLSGTVTFKRHNP
jgi:predicted secreted protein